MPTPVKPDLPTNSSATMKTTAFYPIRRKGPICLTGLNTSHSMALDISPSAARCANVSRLIRMKNSAPIRMPTMPSCYSVTFFHADYHPAEWLRVFGELQSSLEGGRPGGPRPPDRDAIDIHQLFA